MSRLCKPNQWSSIEMLVKSYSSYHSNIECTKHDDLSLLIQTVEHTQNKRNKPMQPKQTSWFIKVLSGDDILQPTGRILCVSQKQRQLNHAKQNEVWSGSTNSRLKMLLLQKVIQSICLPKMVFCFGHFVPKIRFGSSEICSRRLQINNALFLNAIFIYSLCWCKCCWMWQTWMCMTYCVHFGN